MNDINNSALEHLCPNCQAPNQCAQLPGKSKLDCWCMKEQRIKIPEQASTNTRCWCQDCLRKKHAPYNLP